MRSRLFTFAWLVRLCLVVWVGVVVSLVSGRGSSSYVSQSRTARRIERPAAHSFLGFQASPTTSWMQKTVTIPGASSTNALDFDYFVDSEQYWDFLNAYIDGVMVLHVSGPSQSGHDVVSVGAGTHTVKFEYLKDTSGDRGLDTAWVDNVMITANGGQVVSLDNFESRSYSAPGWTSGGYGSGWTVRSAAPDGGIRRPTADSFLGYTSGGQSSTIQRTASWPAGYSYNAFAFSYFVDSESCCDFLNVYVDGAVVFNVSGTQSGTKTISLSTGGTHTIMFEYKKDYSVDVGLDLARVGYVVFLTNDGAFEQHLFDGVQSGTTPNGWTSGGYGGGWVSSPVTPPLSFVSTQSVSPEPVADGILTKDGGDEYVFDTRIALPDYGASGLAADLSLEESDASSALFVAMRGNGCTTAQGGESGTLTLYLDAARTATLNTSTCGANNAAPSAEDRKMVVTYSISPGGTLATASVVQYQGNCTGGGSGWVATSDPWPVTIGISEPQADQGFVHLEAKIVLHPASVSTSSVLSEKRMGFALVRQNTSGQLSQERFPRFDGAPPADGDVSTWETISFDDPQTAAMSSDGRVDVGPHNAMFK